MTNYERIKNMNTEEMADFLAKIGECCNVYDCDFCPLGECEECTQTGIKKWLESEVSK